MSMIRRREHALPGLNTSSLPDLIFTVLFFFMIVTHMRQVTPKVQYKVPAGTELQRLTKKSAVSYIYIGQPHGTTDTRIQLNDKFAAVPEVVDYIAAERSRMLPEDVQAMTVSMKIDKDAPMGVVADVKQALRQANALRVNYSAVERKK